MITIIRSVDVPVREDPETDDWGRYCMGSGWNELCVDPPEGNNGSA